jgi:hypothetical protein
VKQTSLFALVVLPLALGACGNEGAGGETANARAQTGTAGAGGPSADGAPAAGATPAADAIAPADTAARTVGEAIAMSLKANPAPPVTAEDTAGSGPAADTAPKTKYRAGENPEFARKMGWPVTGPKPLPGSILPDKRIVCYYGNPNSKRMGALGEFPREQMLAKLDAEVKKWTAADPAHPALPCLHMVTVVAQGDPGPSGKYRTQMRDSQVDSIYNMIKQRKGIFFIDVQVGQDDIRNFVPRFEEFLKRPDVHFAVDPEFYMRGGVKPGAKIGTMTAADINYVTGELARIVRENKLPPKVLVIHRFTRNMVQGYKDIKLRPEVQIVMDMDGWGAPWLKRDSYRDYIVKEPVQFTGFKLFYHNDTKKGDPLMQPADLLKLNPKPLYIQYQ